MNFSERIKKIDIYDLMIIATIMIVICLGIFTAYQLYTKVPKVRENVILATTKKPETFTELFFEDHESLPSIVAVGDRYPFSFTIHNLEHKTMEYPYEVYADIDGKKELIEKKSVTLPHDNSVTVKETLVVNSATRSAVVVNLTNKNQEIRFWIGGEK